MVVVKNNGRLKPRKLALTITTRSFGSKVYPVSIKSDRISLKVGDNIEVELEYSLKLKNDDLKDVSLLISEYNGLKTWQSQVERSVKLGMERVLLKRYEKEKDLFEKGEIVNLYKKDKERISNLGYKINKIVVRDIRVKAS